MFVADTNTVALLDVRKKIKTHPSARETRTSAHVQTP
jgi:hypothetical protein